MPDFAVHAVHGSRIGAAAAPIRAATAGDAALRALVDGLVGTPWNQAQHGASLTAREAADATAIAGTLTASLLPTLDTPNESSALRSIHEVDANAASAVRSASASMGLATRGLGARSKNC
jgi:hypothetical protein